MVGLIFSISACTQSADPYYVVWLIQKYNEIPKVGWLIFKGVEVDYCHGLNWEQY